jgi:hypothetical protein
MFPGITGLDHEHITDIRKLLRVSNIIIKIEDYQMHWLQNKQNTKTSTGI